MVYTSLLPCSVGWPEAVWQVVQEHRRLACACGSGVCVGLLMVQQQAPGHEAWWRLLSTCQKWLGDQLLVARGQVKARQG